MEVIPVADLKAELKKSASDPVEVILGHTFRVWQDGRSAKDFWVRLTPDRLILSPATRGGDNDESLPGLCCICPLGCGLCCVPKGPDINIYSKDVIACRPSQQTGHEDAFMKKRLKNKVRPEVVGHPVFMILAYPMNVKTGKRLRQTLYFHHMASPRSSSSGKKRGSFSKQNEASKVRDTWVHSILTTFFPSSSTSGGPEDDQDSPHVHADVWSSHPIPKGGQLSSNHHKKLLIVLNPSSGTGQATKIMSTVVGPALQDAGIEYEVLITERANHAYEVLSSEPHLSKRWKGIAIVGGDGTFYEVLNGIYSRPDWQEVFQQIPLGAIPGGSGNGLSRSLIFGQGEPYDGTGITSSMLNVVRGNTCKMDLYLVEIKSTDEVDLGQDHVKRTVGFLHISYGIIADVDIESEAIKGLGEIRFTIYGLLRIAKLRSYKAKIWYKPVIKDPEMKIFIEELVDIDDPDDKSSSSSVSGSKSDLIDEADSKSSNIDDNGSLGSDEASSGDGVSAERDVQEVTITLDVEQKEVQPSVLPTFLPDTDHDETIPSSSSYFHGGRGATYGSLLTQGQLYFRSWNELQHQILPVPTDHFSLKSDAKRKQQPQKIPLHFPSPPPLPPLVLPRAPREEYESRIPALAEELKPESHDDWVYEEGEYINIGMINSPFLDANAMMSPQSQLDDGVQYMLLVRSGTTKANLLKFMIDMEKGQHIHIPGVEIIPVTAFRLIPGDQTGFLTVDGENIPVGPIQAQTMPSMVNLFIK